MSCMHVENEKFVPFFIKEMNFYVNCGGGFVFCKQIHFKRLFIGCWVSIYICFDYDDLYLMYVVFFN